MKMFLTESVELFVCLSVCLLRWEEVYEAVLNRIC